MKKRLVIVGGVAGGAACATRARRLSEDTEIIVFDRGPYISFANCGLPYRIGEVVGHEDDLILATPELFKDLFNIDVRVNSLVRSIDRGRREIEVENTSTGQTYRQPYEALVLSTGSKPILPNLKGINLPGIFTLRDIPDMRRIIEWVKKRFLENVAIVGGGYIGLEMAENLKKLGAQVTIIEMEEHLMPVLDPEMAAFVQEHLEAQGITLYLGSRVCGFEPLPKDKISVNTKSGTSVSADLVVLSMGVRPEVALAQKAGLDIGELGGILVDDHMRTSDVHIWAVGDAVQVKDFIFGVQRLVPLAGLANKQGRIAAEAILGRGPSSPEFRGAQATAVCGVLGLTVAMTGATEKFIRKLGPENEFSDYEKIYLHPPSHPLYYPETAPIHIKLVFSTQDGRILGAQAVGQSGVEKRIDVISTLIQKNGTIFDLEEAELCYSPQYSTPKDPINLAGMAAGNVFKGYFSVVHWENLEKSDAVILDVRHPDAFAQGHVNGAVNIFLNKLLRERFPELPKEREIWVYCIEGERSYYATRILQHHGYKAKNISGGYWMYQAFKRVNKVA